MKHAFLFIALWTFVDRLYSQEATTIFSEVISVDSKEKLIQVTYDNSNPWSIDDSVCVTRNHKDIACGVVIKTHEESAIVQILTNAEEISKDQKSDNGGDYIQLTFDYPTPQKGDSVRLVDKSPSVGIRNLASELKGNKEFGGESINSKIYDHLLAPPAFVPASNLTAGVNLIFPTLEYQQSFTKRSAIGVMPIFMNYSVSDGKLKGTGCFLNYHFYSEGDLNGYWAKAGLGLYGLNYSYRNSEDSGVAPAVAASVGRRIFQSPNLNFGFAAGAQYIFANTSTGLSFSGLVPSLILDVGFAF
ncbi:MAG: hypothetical protein EBR01_08440 [Proteobacteria bacterium]|nr:hypothetical protein [Pseudomonadota bacterium]NBY20455.1 hypothetical protein [bacterium]